jgi:hypothetical protein
MAMLQHAAQHVGRLSGLHIAGGEADGGIVRPAAGARSRVALRLRCHVAMQCFLGDGLQFDDDRLRIDAAAFTTT